MMRIIVAGLVGGSVILLWNTVSHLVLHIGDIGIGILPNENVLVSTLEESVEDAGFYFFPGLDESDVSPADRVAWEEKYRMGPTGVIVYNPSGSDPVPITSFVGELISNIVAALLGAWILMLVGGAYLQRVVVITVLGLFAWMTISVSYALWWGFPMSFVAAEGIETVFGWLLAGLAMAAIARPEPTGTRHSHEIIGISRQRD